MATRTIKRRGPNVVDVSIGVGAEITEGNVMTASSGNNLLAQLSETAEPKMSCCKIAPVVLGRLAAFTLRLGDLYVGSYNFY